MMLGQSAVLTWYGFDLLMNIVRRRHLSATLQIRMDCLLADQDRQEFEELIAQVYARLGSRVTKKLEIRAGLPGRKLNWTRRKNSAAGLRRKPPGCKVACVLV